MSFETTGENRPTFRITGMHELTLDEIIDTFGDPAFNAHREEYRRDSVELISSTGEFYEVQLGLPEPTIGMRGAYKAFEPSYQPHVFTCDRFILRSGDDPNNLLVDEPGLRTLHMHGRWNGEAWVPSDPDLEEKGVTIPGLLSAFEKMTGELVDVVWVCQFDPEQIPHELEVDTDHPYIYPIAGYARGTVILERAKLTVSLEGAIDENSRVEYRDWLAARQQ